MRKIIFVLGSVILLSFSSLTAQGNDPKSKYSRPSNGNSTRVCTHPNCRIKELYRRLNNYSQDNYYHLEDNDRQDERYQEDDDYQQDDYYLENYYPQDGRYGLEDYLRLLEYYGLNPSGGSQNGGDNYWSTSFGSGNYDPATGEGYISLPGGKSVTIGF